MILMIYLDSPISLWGYHGDIMGIQFFFLMELCGKANAIDLPLRMGFSFHKNGDDLGMVAMALVHAPGSISLDGVPGPDLWGMVIN